MPDPNQNNDALAEAVRIGLERAMSPEGPIADLITNIIDYQSSRGVKGGGQRGDDPVDSETRLEAAKNIYRARREAQQTASAANGPSEYASVASTNAEEAAAAAAARQSLANKTGPYYDIPSGFGDIEGNSTWQNVAQAIANRNIEKIINAKSDAEVTSAERGFRRAAYFSDKVLPTYEIGKKIYQQGVQPAYQAIQGLTDVGATQITGGVQGGDIGPMRIPFLTNAFSKGFDIKFNQLKEAIFTPGLNQEQMRMIDSLIMGMGIQYDDSRFRTTEKAIENLVRYNPTIDPRVFAEIIEPTAKFGTSGMGDLINSIKELDTVAKETGVSVGASGEKLAQMLTTFITTAGGGISHAAASSTMKAYMETYPNIDPSKIINTLQTNPIAGQEVLQRRFMPYAAAAMGGTRGQAAMDAALNSAFQMASGGQSIYDSFSNEYTEGDDFEQILYDLIHVFGFSGYTNPEMKSLILGAKDRKQAAAIKNKYFELDKQGGIKRGHAGQRDVPIMRNIPTFKSDEGTGGGRAHTLISDETFNQILRAYNIRGATAQKFKNKYSDPNFQPGYTDMEHLQGWEMTNELRKALAAEAENKGKGPDQSVPGDSYNKLVKSMENATQAAKELQNLAKNPSGSDVNS